MASQNVTVEGDDGITYSLLKGPPDDSKMVIEAQQKFTETLQINELAFDLGNVGKFLLMAYCGVLGHLELEIQVRERLHSVVKLCDDTVHTLNEFNRAAQGAISDMATAYEYLIDGFEDIALETLQDVATTSKAMQEKSISMQERFGAEATEVEKVHNNTAAEKDKVSKENVATQQSIQKYETEQSTAQEELKKASDEEKKSLAELSKTMEEERKTAEERRKIAQTLAQEIEENQKKLDEVDEEFQSNQPQTGVLNAIWNKSVHLIGGKTKDDNAAKVERAKRENLQHQHEDALLKAKEKKEAEDKKAELLKQQRELHVTQLEERAKKREQALKEMATAAKQLAQSKFEADIQSESLFCLHHALTALRHLQDIMTVASNFWRETHGVCSTLTGTKMSNRIDRLLSIDEEKRKRLWGSKAFKMEAVRYYSQWVAVQKVCSESRPAISSAQQQVHLFIRQNPTKEQGKVLLQQLAREFGEKCLKTSTVKEIEN